jgi:hypothetical protein
MASAEVLCAWIAVVVMQANVAAAMKTLHITASFVTIHRGSFAMRA